MTSSIQNQTAKTLNEFADSYVRNIREARIKKLIWELQIEIDELFNENEAGGQDCPDCGHPMREELLSTDLDGLRKEMGYVCPNCG